MRFAHQNPKRKIKDRCDHKIDEIKKHITQNGVKKLILEEVQMLKETLEHYESPETSEELKNKRNKKSK